jgi:hypothetical protein
MRWQGGLWPVSDRRRGRRTTLKRTAKPCGPGARGWRQVGGGVAGPTGHANAVNSPMTEAKGIRLRGERAISRKTTAQGMPECSDCTCMLVCALLAHYCTRDRGCSKHPAFPAPSSFWAKTICKARAQTRRGNAEVYSLVVLREGGGPSIPEPAMIETRVRGVLDTRLRGYDNPLCGERIASFAMMRRLNDSYATFKFRTIRNSAPANEWRLRLHRSALILPDALLNRRP